MQEKQARLTILIDPKVKKQFEKMCAADHLTSSDMVRELIAQYLNAHDVPDTSSAQKKPKPDKSA